MAFIKTEKLGIINFISPKDDAIDTDLNPDTGEPKSDIAAYKEDWDFDKHCVLKEGKEPTKFRINFALTQKRQIIIDNASLGGGGKKEEFGFKLGQHKDAVVRCVLVGIENPDDLPLNQRIIFKTDNTNMAAKELMDDLRSFGILDDIYSFYLTHKDDSDLLKKK